MTRFEDSDQDIDSMAIARYGRGLRMAYLRPFYFLCLVAWLCPMTASAQERAGGLDAPHASDEAPEGDGNAPRDVPDVPDVPETPEAVPDAPSETPNTAPDTAPETPPETGPETALGPNEAAPEDTGPEPPTPQTPAVTSVNGVLSPFSHLMVAINFTQLHVGEQIYPLGCLGEGFLLFSHLVYVGCPQELIRIDLSTGQVLRAGGHGHPTAVFVREGVAWVEFDHQRAFPAEALGRPTQAPHTAGPMSQAEGQVVSFDSGDAVVHFEGPAPQQGAHIEFRNGDETVVARVTESLGSDAEVRVALGEILARGASGRLTQAQTSGSLFLPPRIPGWRFRLGLRGLVGVDTEGYGVVARLDVEWRTSLPLFFRVLIDPVGAGFERGRSSSVGSGHVFTGYDSRVFSLGIGIGGQLIEEFVDFVGERKGVGTSIAGLIRFGSPEGFYVELMPAFTFSDGFRAASFRATVQWPIGHRNWMFVQGYGGTIRIASFLMGFRRLLSGWRPGSATYLLVTLGGADMRSRVDSTQVGGLTFGIGVEHTM